MSKVKKALSLLLALALVFSLFPVSVFAEGAENPDPVEICTGGEDCAAETHNEGCPKYVAPVVTCTGGEDCAAETHNEGCAKYIAPVVTCAKAEGCTLPDGHDGSCNAATAAPAHDCEGQLEQFELDEGEMGWRCPVCGALFDAEGNALPAFSTLADNIVASGTCGANGGNLTWTLDDAGLLTISGAGEMYDYQMPGVMQSAPWAENSTVKSVRVEEGVTSIGEWSFASCTARSISLPSTLTKIAGHVFIGSNIEMITIPASVESIGLNALGGCYSLQQINVAQDNAAYASVDGVLFDKAMTTIVCYPAGRSGPYTVPEGVTKLYYSFFDCRQLTSVVLPSSLKEIGKASFYWCTSLESIVVPSSVETIGVNGFLCCIGLKELSFRHTANDKLSFGTMVFAGPESVATTIRVPDTKNIHSAISGYNWAEDNRSCTYVMDNSNHLDLTGNTDLASQTEVWIDGVAYPIETDNGRYVNLPETGTVLTTFSFQQGTSAGSHDNYPTGMEVYRIVRTEDGATVEKVPELSNLLIYSGCSIRITGKPGIRMITSMTQQAKAALTSAGLADYTLEEYGTVIAWKADLGGEALTLANGKSNYAYKRGVADPVFANVGELTQYTNVLVWNSLEDAQYAQDIAMRPYIILSKDGETVTLYGGTVERSIGYVAQQNADTFPVGSAGYKYVHDIIDKVNGLTGGNG